MKLDFVKGAVAAAGLVVLGSSAIAADLPSRKAAVEPPMLVDTFQPFQIRLKATAVIPDGRSSIIDTLGQTLPLPALLGSAGPGSPIFGAGAKVSTSVIPELDLAYYFTKNIAVEMICCFSKHNVTGTGSIAGLNIGSTWVFPPTVLLQYHFTNFGAFQPYVGIGVNFTAYFGQKAGNNWAPYFVNGLGTFTPGGFASMNTVSNLSISSSWGIAGQVGFDYMLNEHWGINVDLKRIMMEPMATGVVFNSAVNALLGPARAVIPVSSRVNIDPWLVSAGITYRFGGGTATPVVAKY